MTLNGLPTPKRKITFVYGVIPKSCSSEKEPTAEKCQTQYNQIVMAVSFPWPLTGEGLQKFIKKMKRSRPRRGH